MQDKTLQILQEYFGYSTFKPGQKSIIDKILSGHDVLGIMPTGAGKSLCFQIPALALEGTTIVISPLISLMKDQVDTLNEMGIKAAFINSSLSTQEYRSVVAGARAGEYKMIYIAPERLDTESFWELISGMSISLVAVDEAHCVSEWGHDFRPSYTKIADMIAKLPKRPTVAAFTATATPQVKNDIEKLLVLKKPYVLVTGFDRENLYFEVDKPSDKFGFLIDYVKKNTGSSGIVYCSTRKTVESVWEKLNKKGIRATRYHAGLNDSERTANQEEFIYDRAQVIVATNAFGMGIDKSNIRYVVHYNMPKTMENYYQEAGRSGRDGEKAECILLYSAADTVMNKFLIENSGENTDKASDYKKLQEMVDYCNTDSCLRGYILNYFGEQDIQSECDNCGNCVCNTEQTNITLEAQKILSCIKRTGERFGSGVVTDVLKGSNSGKLKTMGFDKLTTYGIMKDYSKETIKEIIAYLISEGFIDIKGEKYPVLALNAKANSLLTDSDQLHIKRLIAKEQPKAQKSGFNIDKELYEILRQLRKEIADKQGVPPFVVFSDATLNDMCAKLPTTGEAMLDVSGVGKFKLEKYGERFIKLINEYIGEKNIIVPEIKPAEREKGRSANEPKKDSRLVTYEMYTSGKSLREICEERGLSQVTIEGHLIDCLEKGLSLEYECFIPKDMESEIMQAIETYGAEKLKPIKDALPPVVTYTAIKFAIWKYKSTSGQAL
ncbi:MAG TPA: DNA helicase RecQ [Clostridia bacterium]|nr:DNA helicase RecQ [Clostridia bacterium]